MGIESVSYDTRTESLVIESYPPWWRFWNKEMVREVYRKIDGSWYNYEDLSPVSSMQLIRIDRKYAALMRQMDRLEKKLDRFGRF